MSFPKDFAWGISTSAYQTEDPGLRANDRDFFKTDWDLFHESGALKFPKGDGTFSFTESERDIRALIDLTATHYRFNVEWARIEPEPGRFNEAALDFYVRLAERLIEENITPIVALWHFTFPSWLTDLKHKNRHGWLHEKIGIYWPRYVRRVVERFRESVAIYAPLNEPNVQSMGAYLANLFPPGMRLNPLLYYRNMRETIAAYKIAAAIIAEVQPEALVMSIQNLVYWKKFPFDPMNIFYRYARDFNFFHLDAVAPLTDIIGFTYYLGEVASPYHVLTQHNRVDENTSDLGWSICPEGLFELIAELAKRYDKPMIVIENGIADQGDVKRRRFLTGHLAAVEKAVESGFDIRGYFHWSLIDNYEWAYGYVPKFGLHAMDPASRKLIAKGSAGLFRQAIQTGTANPYSSIA